MVPKPNRSTSRPAGPQAAPQVDIMEPTQETVVRRGSRESPESPGKASLVLENMLSHVLRSRKRLGQFLPLWKTPSHSELEHWRDGAAPAALSSCPEGKSLFGSTTLSAPVSRMISACQPLYHRLISCVISAYSTA